MHFFRFLSENILLNAKYWYSLVFFLIFSADTLLSIIRFRPLLMYNAPATPFGFRTFFSTSLDTL